MAPKLGPQTRRCLRRIAPGLSPRKVRLATGSLRRSFFALGRLLALTSRQHSMAQGQSPALRGAATAQGESGSTRPSTHRASERASERAAPRSRPERKLSPSQRPGGEVAHPGGSPPRGHRTPTGRILPTGPRPDPPSPRPAGRGSGPAPAGNGRKGSRRGANSSAAELRAPPEPLQRPGLPGLRGPQGRPVKGREGGTGVGGRRGTSGRDASVSAGGRPERLQEEPCARRQRGAARARPGRR